MPFPSTVVGGELIMAAWGNNVVESLPPIGFVGMWPGDTAPVNWLLCRGQAVSRTTYAALFAVHGTRFGAGDGSTTFNMPDFRGRYPIGFNQGGSYFSIGVGEVFGSKDAIVPSHQHGMESHYHSYSGTVGNENQTHVHGMVGNPEASTPGGFGEFNVADAASGFPFVGWTGAPNTPHNHDYAGNTGGASAHNTLFAGSDGTNRNLPPSLSINVIIRAT